MELWKRNVFVLWIGTVFVGMSFSIVSPFLPTLLESVGATDNLAIWSGWAFAASFYTSALLSPVWGTLADKYGRKPQLVRAGFGIGITYVLTAFATSPLQVVLLRFLLGVFSGFIPTAVAMVATNTPEEHLGSALGTIQTGGAFGQVLGPLVGGVLSYYFGIQATLLIAGIGMFTAAIICVAGTNEENKGDREIQFNVIGDVRMAIKKPVLLQMFVLIMVFNLSFMIIQPVLPLYIEQLTGSGDSTVATGVIFSLAGLATVIAAPRWGKRGQRIGYASVLKQGFLGAMVVSFALALSRNLYVLGGMRFVFGLFMAAVMPSTTALIARSVPTGFRSRALSISSSFQQAGGAIGPIIGGYIGSMFGLPVVFAVMGVLLGLLVLWMQRSHFGAATPQPEATTIAGSA